MGNNDGQSFRMYPQVVIYSLQTCTICRNVRVFPSFQFHPIPTSFPRFKPKFSSFRTAPTLLRWTTSCARATTSQWPATACMALPPRWSSPSKAIHCRDRGDRGDRGSPYLMRDSSDISGYISGIWFQKNVDFDRFWSYVSYCIICLMCICVKTEDPWKPQFPVAIVGIWPWHLAGGNPDLFSYRKWKPWIAMKSHHLYPLVN